MRLAHQIVYLEMKRIPLSVLNSTKPTHTSRLLMFQTTSHFIFYYKNIFVICKSIFVHVFVDVSIQWLFHKSEHGI